MEKLSVDAQAFQNKKVFLAPYNDLTRRLETRLKDQGITVAGFFDLNKKGEGIFSYGADVDLDIVIINSPNYWQSIAQNFQVDKVFLYEKFDHRFIGLNDYLRLIEEKRDYDVLFLPFNRSNARDLSMVARELNTLGLTSALIDIGGDSDSDVAIGLAENHDIPKVPRDSVDNIRRKALVASIDWERSFGRPLIEKDREDGVITVGIVDGIEDFEDADYGYERNAYQTVEYVLTMGLDDLHHLQNKPDKATVVGLPKLYPLWQETPTFPKTDRVVINVNFTYGALEECRDDWVSQVIEACEQLNLDYVICQHHADNGQFEQQRISEFDAYDTVRQGSLVISRFSTLILESLVLGKPVVYFNPHDEKVSLFKQPKGAFSVAQTVTQLKQCITHELANKHDVRTRAHAFLQGKCHIDSTVPPAALAAYRIQNLIEEQGHISFQPNKTYNMSPQYVARTAYHHYDDSECEDEWQLEVYLHALGLMKTNDFKRVADFGCGSGYKLIKYLGDYECVGYELDVNVKILQDKYPQHDWRQSDFSAKDDIDVDVLICSDVIEHLIDPDELLAYFSRQSFEYLVISTPDRNLCYAEDAVYQSGPPKNRAHQREWSFDEFGQYIANYFDVIDHRVTNLHQATQMIICKKRAKD